MATSSTKMPFIKFILSVSLLLSGLSTYAQFDTDYWMPPVWESRNNGGQTSPTELLITTAFPQANVSVKLADGTVIVSGIVASGTPLTVPLNTVQGMTYVANTVETNKGLLITSDFPVQAVYRNTSSNNQCLAPLKGTFGLGRDFYAGSQTRIQNDSYGADDVHFVSVMATEDNTTVTIAARPGVNMYQNGNTTTFTLNKHETYLVRNREARNGTPDNRTNNLVGAHVTSDKPIAVMSGAQHVRYNGGGNADAGIDQLVPITSDIFEVVGTEYVVVRGGTEQVNNVSTDYAIIIATVDNTDIFIDGGNTPVDNIDAGEVYEYILPGNQNDIGTPHLIETSQKAYVYHVSGLRAHELGMSAVPAITCTGSKYLEFTRFDGNDNHIHIMAPDAAFATANTLEINGNSYTAFDNNPQTVPGNIGWKTISFEYADTQPTNITVESNEFFHLGIIVGGQPAGTYGYLSGFPKKVDVLDTTQLLPTTRYYVDSVEQGNTRKHTLQLQSCNDDYTITNVYQSSNTGDVTFSGNLNDLLLNYTAKADYLGNDTIRVDVKNQFNVPGTVDLIFHVQGKPVANDDNVAVNEDAVLTGNVKDNDTNLEFGEDAQLVTPPTNGTLTLNPNGSFTYTPNENYNGNDSFTYQLCDDIETSVCDQATVFITVNAVNDGPVNVLPNNALAVNEDESLTFNGNLSVSDEDAGTNPIEVILEVTNGKLTVDSGSEGIATANGSQLVTLNGTVDQINTALNGLAYTGNANFFGTETLTITTDDQGNTGTGGAKSDNDDLTITVNAVNDAPVVDLNGSPSGVDHAVTFVEGDGPVTIAASDATLTDVDNTDLTEMTVQLSDPTATESLIVPVADLPNGISSAYDPGTGILTLTGPAPTTSFQDALRAVVYDNTSQNLVANNRTVNVVATDGTASSTPVETVISITPVNDAPVVDLNGNDTGEDYATTFTEGPTPVAIASMNTTLTDADHTELTRLVVTLKKIEDIGEESLSVSNLPTTLTSNYDGNAGTLTLTGTAPDNKAPIADYLTALQQVTYLNTSENPNTNNRTIEVVANDGDDDSNVATTTVTVQSVNDAPTAADKTLTTVEDLALTITIPDLGYSDPEGDALNKITINQLPTAGTLFLDADNDGKIGTTEALTTADAEVTRAELDANQLKFLSAADESGSPYATFDFTVNDGTLDAVAANTITVNVDAVNDAPTAADNTLTTNEDTPVAINTGDLGYNDIEGTALDKITLNTAPANGVLFLDSNDDGEFNPSEALSDGAVVSQADLGAGRLMFLPALNENGNDYASFDFTVNDGDDDADEASTITFNVDAVNDAPTASSQKLTTDEDTPRVIATTDLGYNDVEGEALNQITISSVPSKGTLFVDANDNGIADSGEILADNAVVTKTPLDANQLKFLPAADESGTDYDGFAFLVNDGTLDAETASQITFDVNAQNDAPTATDNTVETDEDTDYLFAITDFGYADTEGTALDHLEITDLPDNGTLFVDANNDGIIDDGEAVTINQDISSADIAKLTFKPAPNANGDGYDAFDFLVNDGTAYAAEASTMAVNVKEVNDAPLATDQTLTTNEEVALVIATSDLGYSDVENDALSQITINAAPANGTLFIDNNNDGIVDAGEALATNDVVTKAQLDANLLTFLPIADESGSPYTSVDFTVNDGKTDAEEVNTLTFNVDAVNDAPENTVPLAQTVDEDETLEFSSTEGNAITISDDAGSDDDLVVTLIVGEGILTVASGSEAVVSNTGNSSAIVELTGTLTEINTALNGLTYQGNTDANGTETLTIITNDQGNSGSGTALQDTDEVTINVTPVNDAPVADLNGGAAGLDYTASFNEGGSNTEIVDPAATLTDVDDTELEKLTITITNLLNGSDEILSVNNLPATITSNYNPATGILTLTRQGNASVADFQAALRGLVYNNTSENPDASDRTIEVVANDGDDDSQTATITLEVTAVNNPPALSLDADNSSNATTPGGYATTFTEDQGAVAITDTDATLTDADNTNMESATITLTNRPEGADESLSIPAVTGISVTAYDPNTGVLELTGTATIAAYLEAIKQVTYENASQDPTTDDRLIDVVFYDGEANSNTARATINIVLENDAPVADSKPLEVDEASADNPLDLDAPTDVDDTDLTITITGLPTIGTVTLANGSEVADGQEITETQLTGLLYDAPAAYNGTDAVGSFTYKVEDGVNESTGTVAITLNAINDAPTVSNGAVTTPEDIIYVFKASDFQNDYADEEGDDFGNIQITALPAVGELVLNGVVIDAADLNQVVSKADLDAGKLTYDPATNGNGAPYTSFKFQVADDQGAFSTDAYDMVVNVDPVNDAPVIAAPTDIQKVDEDQSLTFAGANLISVSDPEDDNQTVTLSVTENTGTLTLATIDGLTFGEGDGTEDASMTFSGSLADINAALDGLIYAPADDYNGLVNLSIGSDDGNNETDNQAVVIDVDAKNDAPIVSLPAAPEVDEDTPLTFAGDSLISISDRDDDAQEVTIAITDGTFALSQTDGLTFDDNGDGTTTGTMTFTGSLEDINAALLNAVFTPNDNFNGEATLTVTTTDDPVAGTQYSETTKITVKPVADIPVVDLDDNDDSGTTGINYQTAFEEGSPTLTAVADEDVLIQNSDKATLDKVIITLNEHPNGTDEELSIDETQLTNLTVTKAYDDVDGQLILEGVASLAEYQDALKLIVYNNTSDNPTATDRTVSVVVYNEEQASEVATTTITVTPTNDAPEANNGGPVTITTEEDASEALGLTRPTDADNDDANLIINVSVLPAVGTIALSDGTPVTIGQQLTLEEVEGLQYIAPDAYDGVTDPENFEYTISDGTETVTQVVDINLTSVNDAPVATVTTPQNTLEDTPLVFSSANSNTIVVSDEEDDEVTVTINVTNGTFSLPADLPTGVAVTGGGTDQVTLTGAVSDINAALEDASFVPTPDFDSEAAITVDIKDNPTVGDSQVGESKAIAITVDPVNDSPTADNSSVTAGTDEEYPFLPADFATNYSDPENHAFGGIKITGPVTAGTLTLNGTPVQAGDVVTVDDLTNGSLIFTPAAGESGLDYATFPFQVADSEGGYSTDSYEMTINVKVLPQSADRTIAVTEDQPFTLSEIDFAFSDAEGDNFAAVLITRLPANGTLSYGGAAVTETDVTNQTVFPDRNSFTYVTAEHGNGVGYDSFGFRVKDDQDDLSKPHTVTVDATPENDAPVVSEVPKTGSSGRPVTFTAADFIDQFSDVDGDALVEIVIKTLPDATTEGTLTLDGNPVADNDVIPEINLNQLLFTPVDNTVTSASFTWNASDGTVYADNDASVAITFNAQNAPVVSDITKSGKENETIAFTAADFTAAYSDLDEDALQIIQITDLPDATAGVLFQDGAVVAEDQEIAADQLAQLTFVPAADFTGEISFTWNGSDGTAYADNPATVSLTINPADNTAPTAEEDTFTVEENNTLNGTLAGLAQDAEGQPLTFSVVADQGVSQGTLTINPDGTFIYVPNEDYTGEDSFTYQVCDNGNPAACATATITLTVAAATTVPVPKTDSDSDGIPDAVEIGDDPNNPTDTDGDGIPDSQEADSDNDGIPDSQEAGDNPAEPVDSDGDGTPDYQDTDSDGDGLSDASEAGDDPTNPADTDGDGVADYRDTDSDDDGIADATEAGADPANPADTDGDGIPDYRDTDSDGDGIADATEVGSDPTKPADSDQDGVPDYQDTDSDGNGISDMIEAGADPTNPIDSDGDLVPDYRDADNDGDGLADTTEIGDDPANPLDTDEDGVPNYMDTDSDGDGIPDSEEGKLVIYEGFSPNADDKNKKWIIGGIEQYPDNTVQIYNRWGNKIFEVKGYDNGDNAWGSESAVGIILGKELVPDGTYFYILDLGDGSPLRKGYITVHR